MVNKLSLNKKKVFLITIYTLISLFNVIDKLLIANEVNKKICREFINDKNYIVGYHWGEKKYLSELIQDGKFTIKNSQHFRDKEHLLSATSEGDANVNPAGFYFSKSLNSYFFGETVIEIHIPSKLFKHNQFVKSANIFHPDWYSIDLEAVLDFCGKFENTGIVLKEFSGNHLTNNELQYYLPAKYRIAEPSDSRGIVSAFYSIVTKFFEIPPMDEQENKNKIAMILDILKKRESYNTSFISCTN